jgi:hypothetical protein
MGHADKRSVSTDALETLGTIIGPGQGRDAIHLAVEPVVAAEDLAPCEHVGFMDGGVGRSKTPVGIVDPFLENGPRKGEYFWLVVYPRQITSLRHVWTHPAFLDSELPPITEADRENARRVTERLTGKSEKWLRDFCANNDCPSYETVMEVLLSEDGVQLGDVDDYGKTSINDLDSSYDGKPYLTFKGIDAHCDVPSEFWDHFEIVTGKKIKNRPTFFSCSC